MPRVEGFEKLEQFATDTIECINWAEYPYKPSVRFYIGYTEEALLVRYEVEEAHTKAICTTANGPVWEDSCVELFIANPKGEGYFNFEINCVGTLLAAFRQSRTDAEHFSEEKLSKIRRFGSIPHDVIDSRGEGQRWWMVVIVPFSVLGLERAPESLRLNLYKCGDKCDDMHFLSWNPIKLEQPNFHCPEFFGEAGDA